MWTRFLTRSLLCVAFATFFCACVGRAQILISADQEDAIHTGKMHTHVSIARNGHLDATTRSWADNISGFTGSVAVAVLDQSQRLLWVSGTQVCGVDGFSHRTCDWSDTVPADRLSQVRYIAIKHKYTPKREDVGAWLQGIGNNVAHELGTILQAVATTTGLGPPSPPPSNSPQPQGQILISADQEDAIATGKMHTHVSIARNGHLDATTRSWADNISGFTGSVAVAVLDQGRKLLWVSGTQVCGVDAFGRRTCDWSDTIPADKLSQVGYIAIKHKYTPKREDLGTWLRGLGNDLADVLGSILQSVGISTPLRPTYCANRSAHAALIPGDANAVDPHAIRGAYQVGTLPSDAKPVIPPGDDIILYIHGGPGSRLEEASDLVNPLLTEGLRRGKRYTIISFDQPSQGYSSMVDPISIAPAHNTSWPQTEQGKIGTYYPLVAFSEEFIAALIDQLNLKGHNVNIAGGSTGGALTLRMGHRPDPWIKKIVAWNPASVWTTYANDLAKGKALHDGFDRAKEDPPCTGAPPCGPEKQEDTGRRQEFFDQVFGMPTPVTQPNPEEWYRGDRDCYGNDGTHAPFRHEWDCKWDYIGAARLEMQEVYNPAYRRWHWALGTELLLFSFFNDDWAGPANTASGKPANYEGIRKPTMLVAGDDDDWNEGPGLHWENRWTQTQRMAAKMQHTPGYTLYLPDTGHSVHNERPKLFAEQIATFLSSTAQTSPLLVNAEFDESKMPGESCQAQLPQFPRIPRALLDNPDAATFLMEPAIPGGSFSNNKNAGSYSVRLKPELRSVAQRRDPAFALGNAAARYYLGDQSAAYSGDALLWGNAFADLAVTGRTAYENFGKRPPAESEIAAQARNILNPPFSARRPIDEAKLTKAVGTAKIRAYQVAWALRNPNPQAGYELRRQLRWIAVSGEDDPPARPVNVPSGIPIFGPDGKTQVSAYPQYEIPVTMCPTATAPYVPYQCASGTTGSVTFKIRYSVASPEGLEPSRRPNITAAVSR